MNDDATPSRLPLLGIAAGVLIVVGVIVLSMAGNVAGAGNPFILGDELRAERAAQGPTILGWLAIGAGVLAGVLQLFSMQRR